MTRHRRRTSGATTGALLVKVALTVGVVTYSTIHFMLVHHYHSKHDRVPTTTSSSASASASLPLQQEIQPGENNSTLASQQDNNRHTINSKRSKLEQDDKKESSSKNKNGWTDAQFYMLSRLPSVDFFSCCGLGHRMTRLADAYNVAKQLNFTFRIFFGFCGYQEIFSYFFILSSSSSTYGRDDNTQRQHQGRLHNVFWTPQELIKMTSGLQQNASRYYNMNIKINNDAPQFRKLVREGPPKTVEVGGSNETATTSLATRCPCYESRFQSDIEIYTKLRDRFRGRRNINKFREKHFAGRTVIGLHVRAGNGETGQFERKNRTISNIDEWTASMTQQLLSIKTEIEANNQHPPTLFIATDTESFISIFRENLQGIMPVVDLSQTRKDHGEGVLFGERGNVTVDGDRCMDGWEAVISDMILLSYVDVLIAGRPSSLTQSLPMTMVLSTPVSQRKVRRGFCEVNPTATSRICYESLMDWCCNGTTSFSLHTIQRYDYRKFLVDEVLDPANYLDRLEVRQMNADGCLPTPGYIKHCLELEMPGPDRIAEVDESRNRNLKEQLKRKQLDSAEKKD